jgi:hypothetical protein
MATFTAQPMRYWQLAEVDSQHLVCPELLVYPKKQ